MTDLDGLRGRLDGIDEQLIRLFRERMEVVDAVAET